MKWYLKVLKQYAVFSGRARRKEYWMFVLFSFIITIILVIMEGTNQSSNGGSIANIYELATLIPSIAVAVRRMHDVGKSGWFILIPIYNLVLLLTEGDKGSNDYGPDPKEIT